MLWDMRLNYLSPHHKTKNTTNTPPLGFYSEPSRVSRPTHWKATI